MNLCSHYGIPYYSHIRLLPQSNHQRCIDLLINRADTTESIFRQTICEVRSWGLNRMTTPWQMKINTFSKTIDLVCHDAIIGSRECRGRGLGSYLFNQVITIASKPEFSDYHVQRLSWSWVDAEDLENAERRKRFYSRFGIDFYPTDGSNLNITDISDDNLRGKHLKPLPKAHLDKKIQVINNFFDKDIEKIYVYFSNKVDHSWKSSSEFHE